jgi:hypothetical protein
VGSILESRTSYLNDALAVHRLELAILKGYSSLVRVAPREAGLNVADNLSLLSSKDSRIAF